MNRLLVADRGPLAGYIHRSLVAAGIETVAVRGPEGEDPAYMDEATDTAEIPTPDDMDSLVGLALDAGCDGLHPGASRLAENADLPRELQRVGLAFIGPAHQALAIMADRWKARELAVAAGIPVVPGGAVGEVEEPLQRVGLPCWVKDATGGSRRCRTREEVEEALADAPAAAWVEAHVREARHVVVSFLADSKAIVSLGLRERSTRSNGKLAVDQFPAPVSNDTSRTIQEATVAMARAVRFTGAGAVGFLVDPSGATFCLGIRPRMQVGNLLNDAVLGINSPEAQVRIARGETLGWTADQLAMDGHALGVRVRVLEPGVLRALEVPHDVRLETAFAEGCTAEGLLGVLVVRGPTRQSCVVRTVTALKEMVVQGVRTNIPELVEKLAEPRFWAGDVAAENGDVPKLGG